MMGRCVIVGGADINNYSFIREKLCIEEAAGYYHIGEGKLRMLIDQTHMKIFTS